MTGLPASIRRFRLRASPLGGRLRRLDQHAALRLCTWSCALVAVLAVLAACATPSTHIAVEATVAARPQFSPTAHTAHPTPLPFPTATPGGPRLLLEIVRLTDYQLGGAWYVVGDVRNNDVVPRRLVHVAVTFLDDHGKVVGAHIAYVSGPEVLPPGGVAPFALSAPPDTRVARLRVDARGLADPTPTPATVPRP